MILQTGGRSLGATSTRSRPVSRAVSRALLVGMTPSITPSALMTRTGESRSRSLTLKPRSIGPIVSSGDEERDEGLAAVAAGQANATVPRAHATSDRRDLPPRQARVGASQTYALRFLHRVVKVWLQRE